MPDIQHEYYIRQSDDTEARGPFTLAQLSSLAGSGGLDARTLYFDAGSEQWLPVTGSRELGILLRNAPASAREGAQAAPEAPFVVRVRVARALLLAGAVVLLLIGFASMERGGGIHTLLSQPFFWLGVIDVFLGACAGFLMGRRHLALVIRARAALGLGVWVAVFWLVAAMPALLFAVAASACLWLATVFASRRALYIDAIAGLAALAGFAYCVI